MDALLRVGFRPSSIPPLKRDVAERYVIPPSDRASIIYIELPLDEIEDAIERSAAMQNARECWFANSKK